MLFTALGGANEVGASCSLLQVAGRNILVDAGIRVNRRGAESLPDLERLHDKVGAHDWGIPPEMLDMYRYGHAAA